MSSDRNSYSSIIKAISLFGGVKVFQILISIIRSKIIAILIGPAGMGIESLLTSTVSMVTSITGFGLQISGVRNISKAHSSNDEDEINKTVSVLRKIVWLTGVLGVVVTFVFANYLSKLAFGNIDNSNSFRIIAVILLFNQLNVGQTVLLQGTFHYKYLAKASLYGNIMALLLTVPLYYFWRTNGIVPAIVTSSVITLFFSWYYSKKVGFEKINLSLKQTFLEGKEMVVLGFILAAVGLIGQLSGYLMNIVISHFGSLVDVGLYSAGYNIANTYVFLILSSMSTDYVPRLSAVSNDNFLLSDIINKQAILLVTLITPIIIIFIVLIKEIVILLYSKEFLPVIGMIEWIMFGMLFRSISWAISYSFIARGNSKVFFWNELIISIISLSLNTLGYYLFGFTGLGFSFIATYLLYTIQLIYLGNKQFGFSFTIDFYKILIPQLLLCTICIISTKLIGYSFYRYIVGLILFSISMYLTYGVLDKLVGVKPIILEMSNKLFKKSSKSNFEK